MWKQFGFMGLYTLNRKRPLKGQHALSNDKDLEGWYA